MSEPDRTYLEVLENRVVVFDGAMGTSIQARNPTPADFGGEALEGCNDHLVFTRPDLIREIHASFLEVGCDAVETNTFRANRVAIREYGLEGAVVEMNRRAAELAREVTRAYASKGRPRFVAGSIGPSGLLPSSSDPELGNVTYEELVDVFREQSSGLLLGGVDLLLIETGQDILEVKAAVAGARLAMRESARWVPIQAQVTLDTSGRMLLGTDPASAQVTLEALKVDVLGLNCSTGPEHMRDPLGTLSAGARTPLSVIPNAGIPVNRGGVAEYPLTAEELARAHRDFVDRLGVTVVGGCCGTTPDHIAAVVEAVRGRTPKRQNDRIHPGPRVSSGVRASALAQIPAPTLVGERVTLRFQETEEYQLYLGQLDPVTQESGVRQRLENLGYLGPDADPEELDVAIILFKQEHCGLAVDAQDIILTENDSDYESYTAFDDDFRKTLVEVHGS